MFTRQLQSRRGVGVLTTVLSMRTTFAMMLCLVAVSCNVETFTEIRISSLFQAAAGANLDVATRVRVDDFRSEPETCDEINFGVNEALTRFLGSVANYECSFPSLLLSFTAEVPLVRILQAPPSQFRISAVRNGQIMTAVLESRTGAASDLAQALRSITNKDYRRFIINVNIVNDTKSEVEIKTNDAFVNGEARPGSHVSRLAPDRTLHLRYSDVRSHDITSRAEAELIQVLLQ